MDKNSIHAEVVCEMNTKVRAAGMLINSEPLQELLNTIPWEIRTFIRDELYEKS